MDSIKVQEAEKEKWLHQQYQHIHMLSGQVECAWRMINGKLHLQQEGDMQEQEGHQYSDSSGCLSGRPLQEPQL